MHSSSFLALFASVATAQSTVSLMNIWQADKTLTFKGADATATTYEQRCPPQASGQKPQESSTPVSSAASSSAASSIQTPSDIVLTPLTGPPTPRPTAQALARRASSQSEENRLKSGDWCAPYTLIQGSETWEFHLTDTAAPDWTINANCKWQGESTKADFTCTATFDGDFTLLGEPGTSTMTLPSSDINSLSLFAPVTIVSATDAAPTGPASTAPASSTPASGLAPQLALPTGAAALVGGAAGIFAAALAL